MFHAYRRPLAVPNQVGGGKEGPLLAVRRVGEIRKGRSVIAEVFPPMLRNWYAREDRTVDQQDAYAVARWLKEMDAAMTLDENVFWATDDRQRTEDC